MNKRVKKMNKRVKIFTHFLFLSIILSALSCGRNENGRSDASDLINILVNKPENRSLIKISDIVDKVEIIPLEFNDSCIIGKIKKLEIFDNKIYILDGQNRRHLYVFNMQGKFLRTIGHLGKGPKEHQDLTDFDIDREKDVVIILDNASEKLIEYDQQGNFIKTVHVTAPADNFAVSNNLIYMYRASPQIYTKYDLNNIILMANMSGVILNRWLTMWVDIHQTFFLIIREGDKNYLFIHG